MKKEVLLSIIIPMYNLESYICDGIESVLGAVGPMNSNDYEIIVVDDKSSDASIEAVKKNINIKNLKIIEKDNNSGVSDTRNTGLKESSGKYVAFFDGDDKLSPEIYYKAINKLASSRADFLIFYSCEILNNGMICKSKYDYSKFSFATDLLSEYLNDKISMSVCDKVYRRDFLIDHKIEFDNTLFYGEDVIYNLCVLNYTNNVAFLDEVGYLYLQRESSAMHVYKNKMLGLASIANNIPTDVKKKLKNNYLYDFENFKIIEVFKTIHAVSRCVNKYNKKIISEDLKEVIDKEILKYVLHSKKFGIFYKVESFNIYVFGIKFHLKIFKLYDLLKSLIRH